MAVAVAVAVAVQLFSSEDALVRSVDVDVAVVGVMAVVVIGRGPSQTTQTYPKCMAKHS